MSYGKEQEKEIETIKGRTITLQLSDADVDRLLNKAGEVGLTASELLENFVGDLVCGTYSNGSDERDYANEWFERCGFSWPVGEMSFLQWLISEYNLEEVLEAWNDLQELLARGELDEDNKGDEEAFKDTIGYDEKIVNDLFSEYKKKDRAIKDCTLEKEMEKVMQWCEEREALKNFDVEKVRVEHQQFRSIIRHFDPDFFNRKCRVCGCTWNHACDGGCYWVADDLCSRCNEIQSKKN